MSKIGRIRIEAANQVSPLPTLGTRSAEASPGRLQVGYWARFDAPKSLWQACGAVIMLTSTLVGAAWLLWWTYLWAGWVILPDVTTFKLGGRPLAGGAGEWGCLPAIPVGFGGAWIISRLGQGAAARCGFVLPDLDALAEAEAARSADRT